VNAPVGRPLLRATVRELPGSPDLAALAGVARDLGHEVILIERPMPDAVSVLGIGRALELVSAPGGIRAENTAGDAIGFEAGPPLAAASVLWRRIAAELVAEDEPGLPGTGLLALGGFAFDPAAAPASPWEGFPGVLLRVPGLAVSRVRGRTFACVLDAELEELLDLPAAPAAAAPAARHLDLSPAWPGSEWMAMIARASELLRRGAADKVVLARELVARADGVINAGAVVRSLRAAYPACFTYLVSGADGTAFAGATPELLVRRSGVTAVCQPMAGSTARGRDEAEDDALATELLASAKNRSEHRVTATAVRDALAPFSSEVDGGEPEVVRFTNIQHLATTVRARLLLDDPAPALRLAAALHPTPAVAGHPRGAAVGLIASLEGMERGWYAGGVGWTDARGDGEFAVALRCGLLWEDGARLYAGVGVMPDSDPAAELAETDLKFRALLGALTG
jgi:menaquinone-specific isochorismate synthase